MIESGRIPSPEPIGNEPHTPAGQHRRNGESSTEAFRSLRPRGLGRSERSVHEPNRSDRRSGTKVGWIFPPAVLVVLLFVSSAAGALHTASEPDASPLGGPASEGNQLRLAGEEDPDPPAMGAPADDSPSPSETDPVLGWSRALYARVDESGGKPDSTRLTSWSRLVPLSSESLSTLEDRRLVAGRGSPGLPKGGYDRTSDDVGLPAEPERPSRAARPSVPDTRKVPADVEPSPQAPVPDPLVAIGLAGVAGAAVAVPVLYRRVLDEEVLDNTVRQRLLEMVKARPATYQTELARALDLHPSTVAYHGEILEEAGHVFRERDGREIRYYPVDPDADETEADLHAALRREAKRKVVEVVWENPGVSISEVAQLLGRHPSNVTRSADFLVDRDVLDDRSADGRRELVINPEVSDQLVDILES